MKISEYVDRLTDANLFYLVENTNLCSALRQTLRESTPKVNKVLLDDDKDAYQQQVELHQRKLKRALESFQQQQQCEEVTCSFFPFSTSPSIENLVDPERDFHPPPVLHPETRQVLAVALTQFLNHLQSVILPKQKHISTLPMSSIPCVAIQLLPQEKQTDDDEDKEDKNLFTAESKHKKKPNANANAKTKTKNQKNKRPIPYQRPADDLKKKRKSKKKKAPVHPPHQRADLELKVGEKTSADPQPVVAERVLPFAKRFTLKMIQQTILTNLKTYQESLRFEPGMTSVDRRRHYSVIRKVFYLNYMKQVLEFMDGFLFPHKELRKLFESQLALLSKGLPLSAGFPPFTKQELQDLSRLLMSHITESLDLSEKRKTKIRNLILRLEVSFHSFLDFSHFICTQLKDGVTDKAEEDFAALKSRWTHLVKIGKPPYNSLGKSTRDQIEKGFQYYKLKNFSL